MMWTILKYSIPIVIFNFQFFGRIAAQEQQLQVSTIQDICWSPGGKSLFFSGMWHRPDYSDYKPESWSVYRFDLVSRKIEKIAESAVFVSVSPTGNKIAVGKSIQGNRDIFVMDQDGKHPERLTFHNSQDAAPAWSPDGGRIAFTSERYGKPSIFLIGTDGQGLRQITFDDSLACHNPQWSPDGERIVYYREKGDGQDQIHVMNWDGANPVNITSDTLLNYFPAWTPDNRIIYTQDQKNGPSKIITCKPNGEDKKQLLQIESYYARVSPRDNSIAFIDRHDRCIRIVDSSGNIITDIYLPKN